MKVKCDWDTCKYNEENVCKCKEVVLVDVIIEGKGSMLDCKSFEWGEEEE